MVCHFNSLGKRLDRNSAQYDRTLLIGDLNSETTEKRMESFCDIYHLKNLAKEPTCLKNPNLRQKFPRYTSCRNMVVRFS